MSGHTFGSMLWGFLFWIGFVLNILLFGMLVVQQFLDHVVTRWVARILGSLGIITGLYLSLSIVSGSSLIDVLIHFVTGLPATALILLFFGSPAILGLIVIWRST